MKWLKIFVVNSQNTILPSLKTEPTQNVLKKKGCQTLATTNFYPFAAKLKNNRYGSMKIHMGSLKKDVGNYSWILENNSVILPGKSRLHMCIQVWDITA